jgi:nitrate/nitrite transporter NarK
LVFSRADAFVWLLLGRAIVGLGDALIWVNLVIILAKRYLPQQFGALLGIVGMGGNLGALLTTLPFAAWIAAAGWRTPFSILAGVLMLVAVCDWLALSGGRGAAKRRRDGGLSDADPDSQENRVKIHPVPVRRILADVVRDRLSWATFACHFGIVGTYMGFVSLWAVPYFMAAYHVSRAGASSFTLVGFIGALVGGPITGAMSDRMGSRRRPYVVLQALVALSWITLWLGGGAWPAVVTYVQMLVIGFGNGGSLLTFAAIRDQTPMERSGVMSGFANTGGFFSAVLLPVAFGAVVDALSPQAASSTPSMHALAAGLMVPAVFSVIGVAGALLLPERQNLSEKSQEVAL